MLGDGLVVHERTGGAIQVGDDYAFPFHGHLAMDPSDIGILKDDFRVGVAAADGLRASFIDWKSPTFVRTGDRQ
jgi:hypothetical protein